MSKILVLIFLLPSVAFGDFVHSECGTLEYFKSVFIRDSIKKPCRVLKEVDNAIKITSVFAGPMEPITLFLEHPSYVAQTSISGLMLLSERQKGWDEVRVLKKTELIWVHEYGHVIFNQWLLNSFKEVNDFYKFMVEHDSVSIKNKDPYADNFLEVKKNWSNKAQLARDIQKPYSELFADIVTVLFANDKNAMAFTMKVKGMDKQHLNNIKLYSFSEDIKLSDFHGSDAHFLLSPSRPLIGQKFLKFPLNNVQKKSILKKIHKVLVFEMRKWWRNGGLPSYEKLNESLIMGLKKELE